MEEKATLLKCGGTFSLITLCLFFFSSSPLVLVHAKAQGLSRAALWTYPIKLSLQFEAVTRSPYYIMLIDRLKCCSINQSGNNGNRSVATPSSVMTRGTTSRDSCWRDVGNVVGAHSRPRQRLRCVQQDAVISSISLWSSASFLGKYPWSRH